MNKPLVKIRMTDSLGVAKFSYIKPEFEREVPEDVFDEDPLHCYGMVAEGLREVVEYQLSEICRRASPQDKVMIKNSLDVDQRLKDLLASGAWETGK